jgi:hypothetical protein
MNELLIAAIAIVLLFFIISKARKRSKKFPESAMQAEKSKLANKPILNTELKKEPLPEPQAKEPSSSTEPTKELLVESKTNETVILPPKGSDKILPQDSMLRRHYLTNLRTMIESLKPPRPTEFSLSRHYEAMISSEIEQCVSDQGAVERLSCKYEAHKKTLAQHPPQPTTLAEPLLKAKISPEDTVVQLENTKQSEDSTLSQHTNTNLNASAESNMPLPPTDSVLRRHYDTMINTEINKLLNHKED